MKPWGERRYLKESVRGLLLGKKIKAVSCWFPIDFSLLNKPIGLLLELVYST